MTAAQADERAHHRRRFRGRDPEEHHRAATPLELLYDLTLVVAFGVAADELAHYVADDHVLAGVAGFASAAFAASWAWVNYSWFASAAAVLLAAAGVGVPVCLIVVALAPVVTVVGYETIGHRHLADAIRRL